MDLSGVLKTLPALQRVKQVKIKNPVHIPSSVIDANGKVTTRTTKRAPRLHVRLEFVLNFLNANFSVESRYRKRKTFEPSAKPTDSACSADQVKLIAEWAGRVFCADLSAFGPNVELNALIECIVEVSFFHSYIF